MEFKRNLTQCFRTPAAFHGFYQNIFVDAYCFFFNLKIWQMWMKWISLFQEKGKKINFIAQHVAFFSSVFQICCKTRPLHVFLIEKFSTTKNHKQILEDEIIQLSSFTMLLWFFLLCLSCDFFFLTRLLQQWNNNKFVQRSCITHYKSSNSWTGYATVEKEENAHSLVWFWLLTDWGFYTSYLLME